jgi:hypothetical protein
VVAGAERVARDVEPGVDDVARHVPSAAGQAADRAERIELLRPRRAGRALLRDVGQLVADQRAPGRRRGGQVAAAEADVGALGHRERALAGRAAMTGVVVGDPRARERHAEVALRDPLRARRQRPRPNRHPGQLGADPRADLVGLQLGRVADRHQPAVLRSGRRDHLVLGGARPALALHASAGPLEPWREIGPHRLRRARRTARGCVPPLGLTSRRCSCSRPRKHGFHDRLLRPPALQLVAAARGSPWWPREWNTHQLARAVPLARSGEHDPRRARRRADRGLARRGARGALAMAAPGARRRGPAAAAPGTDCPPARSRDRRRRAAAVGRLAALSRSRFRAVELQTGWFRVA